MLHRHISLIPGISFTAKEACRDAANVIRRLITVVAGGE
jgi:hypothetical protein